MYLKLTSENPVWIVDTRKARKLAQALSKGNVSWVPSLKTLTDPSIQKDVREIPNPKSQIPNPKMRKKNKSQIPNPKFQIPNYQLKISNLKSFIHLFVYLRVGGCKTFICVPKIDF